MPRITPNRFALPTDWRRRALALPLVAGLGYLAIRALVGSSDELVGAADLVGRPRVGWLLAAVVAEVGSYACYGAGQRRLLAALGHRARLAPLTGLAAAAQAIGSSLPGGYGWNNVYCFRVLRRWGVSGLAAGRLLLATSVLYVAALALLAVVGAQLPGDRGPAGEVRALGWAVLGLLVVAGALLTWRGARVRRAAARAGAALLRRLPGTPGPEAWSGGRDARLPLGHLALAVAAGWLLASWLCDLGCLSAAFAATGSAPPWSGLVVAYTAGQLAAMLPVTPGGLGVVEGSLTLALVTYGGGRVATLAAVLLYRLVSFWGLLPAGGACFLLLRRGHGGEEGEAS